MGHFVKHIFLLLILKVNVEMEITFCSTLNKGEMGMAHPVRWGWEVALNLFSFVKASKEGFPYTYKI